MSLRRCQSLLLPSKGLLRRLHNERVTEEYGKDEEGETFMHIRVGYDLIYHCPQATPMILLVNMHSSRASDIVVPDYLTTEPSVPITAYRDPFGNWCTRLVAPAGQMRFSSRGVVRDSGQPDVAVPSAPQHAVEDLPEETLVFLRGSRYCETDVLSQVAWDLFEKTPPGWARVQAICDYVHTHLTFGYAYARATKTAFEAFNEQHRRLSRLYPPCYDALPLYEYSRALLYRVSGRHWHSACLESDGFCRLDGSVPRWPLVYL